MIDEFDPDSASGWSQGGEGPAATAKCQPNKPPASGCLVMKGCVGLAYWFITLGFVTGKMVAAQLSCIIS